METPSGKPRDARIIEAILRAMGVDQYDPRVVNQLLELLYRYVSGVLLDARNVCEHTFKQQIDAEDIKLAIKSTCSHSFLQPPPREVTMRIAAERNSVPLPQVDQKAGLSLPNPEYQLTGQNYDYVFEKNPKSPMKRNSPTHNLEASPSKRQRLSPTQRPNTEPPKMLNKSSTSGTINPTAAITSKNTSSPVKTLGSPAKASPTAGAPSLNRSLQQSSAAPMPAVNPPSSVQPLPLAKPPSSVPNLQKPPQTIQMQTNAPPVRLATQTTPPPTSWNQPAAASGKVQQPTRQSSNVAGTALPPPPQQPPPT